MLAIDKDNVAYSLTVTCLNYLKITYQPYKSSLTLPIKWAFYPEYLLRGDMGIDHRRLKVFMAEQLLNRPYIITLFKQVSGKTVPQRMHRGLFRNTCFPLSNLERLL